jgi:hypothetical protein
LEELPEPENPLQNVIKAHRTRPAANRVLIPAGSWHGHDGDPAPTVILEKTADNRIRKITVRCACGRHAELACEYDDEGGDP